MRLLLSILNSHKIPFQLDFCSNHLTICNRPLTDVAADDQMTFRLRLSVQDALTKRPRAAYL